MAFLRPAASLLLLAAHVVPSVAFVSPGLYRAPRSVLPAGSFAGRAGPGPRIAARAARTAARPQGLVGLRAEADYYAQLGVSRGASEQEIKSAFRQKARKLHPDVNKAENAQQQFQEIQHAYEVLSDPQKKSLYDR